MPKKVSDEITYPFPTKLQQYNGLSLEMKK